VLAGANEISAIPEKNDLWRGTHAVEEGSTRLWRVVYGVSPQTSSNQTFVTKDNEEDGLTKLTGETPSMARETRAVPMALHGSV